MIQMSQTSRKIALLIGVSEYGQGLQPLPATLNDIEKMKQILENLNIGGFDDVKQLINPNLEKMQTELESLFKHRNRDDLVLLFFSGHGITDESGRLYLATCNTSKNTFRPSSVPATFVHDVMNESSSKRQVIILDCCYSGAFAQTRSRNDTSVDIKRQLGGEGRVLLSSSTAVQPSFETEESGIYTRYLVEGIETGAADLDQDGYISVAELHEYARKKVEEAKPAMQPEMHILNKEGYTIVLAQVVQDRKLSYRRLVERYDNQGKISQTGRKNLEIKREEFGLSRKEAEEIEDSVLKPYRQRAENLQRYEEALVQEIRHKFPLNAQDEQALKDYQKSLGLRDEDVKDIRRRVMPKRPVSRLTGQAPIAKPWLVLLLLVTAGIIISVPILFLPYFQAVVLYNEANNLKDKNQNAAALQLYNQVVQIKPDFYDAWTNRGYVLGKLNLYEESFNSCKKAIELEKNSIPALNCQGNALRKLQRYSEAIAAYDRIIALDPKSVISFNNRGETLLDSQQHTAALDDFNQAINIDNNSVFAWNNKGRALDRLSEYTEAVNAFAQATKLKPDYYYAWINLGDTLKKLNRNQEAVDAYKTASLIKPNSHEDWYLIGQALEKLGQSKEAVDAYQQAISIMPSYTEAIKAKQRLQRQ
jgi:tetratricopeptide (TPR) repeat protein